MLYFWVPNLLTRRFLTIRGIIGKLSNHCLGHWRLIEKVVANCDHLEKLKFSKALPLAFTEHGAIMAASVLNLPKAVEVSVFVVRAFVQLRETIAGHKELARKIANLERKLGDPDEQWFWLRR